MRLCNQETCHAARCIAEMRSRYARWPLLVRIVDSQKPGQGLRGQGILLEDLLVAKKHEVDGGFDNLSIPALLEDCRAGRPLPTS